MATVEASDVAWGADGEYGRLLDLLVCPPDYFQWLPTRPISSVSAESKSSAETS